MQKTAWRLGVVVATARYPAKGQFIEGAGFWTGGFTGPFTVLVNGSADVRTRHLGPIPAPHERIAYHEDQVD